MAIFRTTLLSSASVGVSRAVSIAFGFAQSVLLARVFGAEDFGKWMLVVGFAGILALVSRLGLDTALLVRAARLIGSGQHREAQLATVASVWTAAALGLLPLSVLLLAPGGVAFLLGDATLSGLLVAYGGAIVISQVSGQLVIWLRANDMLNLAAVLGDTVPVVIHVVLLALLWRGDLDLTIVSFAYASVGVQALLLVMLVVSVQKRAPIPWFSFQRMAWHALIGATPAYYGTILAAALGGWLAFWALSVFGQSEEIAHLGVAMRLVSSGGLIVGVMSFVIVPRLANKHAAGDTDGFREQFDSGLTIATAVALPLLLLIVLFSESLLSLWGASFSQAVAVVWILALGEAVNILTGSCGYALNVSGHERTIFKIAGISLVLNAVLTLLLVPQFGLLGAAWAITITTVLEHLARSQTARVRLGIYPFPFNLWSGRQA